MTIRRAAVYLGGGALLLAYLAAANSAPTSFAPPPRDSHPDAASQPDAIAADVRAQATRLRERLAVAPVPDPRARNPFSFAPTADASPASSKRAAHATVADPAPPDIAPPPLLSLVGIAEDAATGGVRRTAIISGSGDALYMVTEGETVATRYRVAAIGADAVELTDLLTGGYRRLAMR